jgi:hypothetical protein
MKNTVAEAIGRRLARFLTTRLSITAVATCSPAQLAAALQPGDVLLVEGDTRVSVAIKYLTQSTWSHAAIYVGPQPELPRCEDEIVSLVEADLNEGVRAVPLARFANFHTRICRPVGLRPEDRECRQSSQKGAHHSRSNSSLRLSLPCSDAHGEIDAGIR